MKLVCSLDRYADLTAGTMEGLMLKPARKDSYALFYFRESVVGGGKASSGGGRQVGGSGARSNQQHCT